MRFYPRSAKSRADALAMGGHIGQHSTPDQKSNFDRLKRYKPAVQAVNVLIVYGGSK